MGVPTDGLYGIENGKGLVSVDNAGYLYGSAQIFLFVLAIGAFISVTMRTGAIQRGIGRLALRFKDRPAALIIVIMLVFAIGGTTEGMWEETLGFFALLVPLALALGFDRMTGAAMIFFGAGTGVLASTVNPFATGVASDAAGIEIGDGIGLRLAMWVVLVTVGILFVLRYAFRVRKDHEKSVMRRGGLRERRPADGRRGCGRRRAPDEATQGHPDAVLRGLRDDDLRLHPMARHLGHDLRSRLPPLPVFNSFYFAQATVLFIVVSVIIGLIDRLGEKGTVDAIIVGAGEFLGAALIIVLARAVTVVMKNAFITDTILHWTENAVTDLSGGVFASVAILVNLPIAFLVPSSSGHAALVMPILGPLADFADVPRSLSVTAYQTASGLVNLITPTSVVIMGGLTLSKIGYDRYLRFAIPYFLILLVLTHGLHVHRIGDRLMAMRVDSEVGQLRKVIVHRPGLEQRRLTPDNAEDLLFDDVIWVRKAKVEHAALRPGDARARYRGLRRRGPARRGACRPRRHRSGCSTRCSTSARSASTSPAARREWAGEASAKEVADFLIGGMTKAELTRAPGLFCELGRADGHGAAAAAELPLPARSVLVDLRRRDHQPDDEARAATGDGDHARRSTAAIRCSRPATASTSGSAGSSRTGGHARSRAATSRRSATAP